MSQRVAIIAGFILVAISAGISLWAYPQAPPQIPVHWDFAGSPNGYMPKLWGLALWPTIMLLLWVSLPIIPSISPKGFRLGSSVAVFDITLFAIMLFLFALDVVAVRASLGSPGPTARFAVVAIGVLFTVVGNLMPKIRKNFFFGYRAPWSLASDEVWIKTQRFAGWLWTLSGVAYIAIGLVNASLIV